MKQLKYDANGNRIVKYNSIYKSIKRDTLQWKDGKGIWHMKRRDK